MSTSEQVKDLALYASACCEEETLFVQNDTFTRCPKCEKLCFWSLVEPVVSWIELEEQMALEEETALLAA